ncbi:MAG: phytanoyl-CoA dioxygenase family protein [Fuerstiella sp.]
MPAYETTAEQQEQLRTDGFVLLPRALPDNLLATWRDLAEQLEAAAMEAHARSEWLPGVCVIEDPVGPRLMRCDDILERHGDAVVDLLACPAMMAVARELCGRGTVPLQCDILYKHQHPHPVINWHQGAAHPRGYAYLNVGIYLDDADANDGCLQYVPGTQHELQNICELSETYGWDIPGAVEQPAQAGDILVQDMMILHGSPPRRSHGVRRTIYVELRPATGITESGAQSEQWKKLRERWMGIVVRRADASDWPADWIEDLPGALGTDEEEIASISALHEPPIPAVYCHRSVETANYPVPADLQDL